MCDFINTHEDLVNITTFGEYRKVMVKVMKVIREAHNVEKKRRQTSRKKRGDEAMKRTQRVKALIVIIKQGKMNKDEIERNIEKMFGKGCKEENEKVTTMEKIVERVEEMSKRETQLEEWETMRKEAKRRQREDRRHNLFWRRNKTFPMQFGGDEETPGVEETLEFWRKINNKEVPEGWKEDRDIRGALYEVKKLLQKGRMCRWFEFT